MADRRSLGWVGLIFAAVTAAVMLGSMVVVKAHIDGRLSLEDRQPFAASAVPAPRGAIAGPAADGRNA
jgi:hypothetical protein